MTLNVQEQVRLIAGTVGDPTRLAFALVDLVHATESDGVRATIKLALSAAAVPHWFDAMFLSALLGISHEEGARLFSALSQLSVVESFPARGRSALCVHDASREELRETFRRERPEDFVACSQRAWHYLASDTSDHARIERIYHMFAFDRTAAIAECGLLHDRLSASIPEACPALLLAIEELDDELGVIELKKALRAFAVSNIDAPSEFSNRMVPFAIGKPRKDIHSTDDADRARDDVVERDDSESVPSWADPQANTEARALEMVGNIMPAVVPARVSPEAFPVMSGALLKKYHRQTLRQRATARLLRMRRKEAENSLAGKSEHAERTAGEARLDIDHDLARTLKAYRRALGKLTEAERDLVVARVELGLSWREVSAVSGLSLRDARLAVRRALVRLAETLTGMT